MTQPIKIESLPITLGESDLFICSSSFEERCLVVPSVFKSYQHFSLIFYSENEYQKIIDNSLGLEKLFWGRSKRVSLNTDMPFQNGVKINLCIDEVLNTRSYKRIFVDTTTFTHETLLVIFRLLFFKKEKFEQLHILYVGAEKYSTNESEGTKKWLSAGISAIRTVLGFPGVLSPARDNHLVVLCGFESERTKSLIENMQFETISLAFGGEGKSIDASHQQINYDRHCKLMDYYKNANKFDISLIDPFETKKEIELQIKKFPAHNVVIAPMNNKLSTIGAALVSIDNPKAQIIYAKPIEYNVLGYSTPRRDCYHYRIF
jgi:hypothetical protein